MKAKPSSPVWRRGDETGLAYALKLTAAGAKAIAIDEGEAEVAAPCRAPWARAACDANRDRQLSRTQSRLLVKVPSPTRWTEADAQRRRRRAKRAVASGAFRKFGVRVSPELKLVSSVKRA